jgi:ATP synthase F1 gamma subunit
MIPIVKLKRNIDFNKNLGEIVEVMKLTATLQYNQFRSVKEPFSQFLGALESSLAILPVSASAQEPYGFFRPASSDLPRALILISSDSGFLGELSTVLTNRFLEIMQKRDVLIVIGQQGAGYLNDLHLEFQHLPSIPDRLELAHIISVRDHVINLFVEKKISGITAVYPRFLNLTSQQVEVETLFPLVPQGRRPQPDEPGSPGWLKAGGAAQRRHQPDGSGHTSLQPLKELLIEPSSALVQRRIAELLLSYRLYQIFWSSKLAEYSARIMHLESSSRELTRINAKHRLEYFKYIHSLSDKTIREIFAARLKVHKG